jgi:hypothetical protein
MVSVAQRFQDEREHVLADNVRSFVARMVPAATDQEHLGGQDAQSKSSASGETVRDNSLRVDRGMGFVNPDLV